MTMIIIWRKQVLLFLCSFNDILFEIGQNDFTNLFKVMVDDFDPILTRSTLSKTEF